MSKTDRVSCDACNNLSRSCSGPDSRSRQRYCPASCLTDIKSAISTPTQYQSFALSETGLRQKLVTLSASQSHNAYPLSPWHGHQQPGELRLPRVEIKSWSTFRLTLPIRSSRCRQVRSLLTTFCYGCNRCSQQRPLVSQSVSHRLKLLNNSRAAQRVGRTPYPYLRFRGRWSRLPSRTG